MNGLALFAGVSGLELGVSLAEPGYRTVGFVERDSFSASVLVARMEEAALDPCPVWDSVESLPGSLFRGRVDLVTAGFPCQPFSHAGKGRAQEDERWLWPAIERVLLQVRPWLVFLENVPPLVSRGLDRVLLGLAHLGFDAEWDVFSASGVGAPHRRRRLFLLAAHSDCVGLWEHQQRRPGRRAAGVCDEGHAVSLDDGSTWPAPDTDGDRRQIERGSRVPHELDSQLGHDTDRRSLRLGGVWEGGPAAEPTIRRVDDGTTARLDRLRALGNGVVPSVAARAYLELKGRILWD